MTTTTTDTGGRGVSKLYAEKQITVREYNMGAIKELVEEYLNINSIAGEKYTCDRVEHSQNTAWILIHLSPGEGGWVDEDFDDDEAWKNFCSDMAKALEVRGVSVPHWYYPK